MTRHLSRAAPIDPHATRRRSADACWPLPPMTRTHERRLAAVTMKEWSERRGY